MTRMRANSTVATLLLKFLYWWFLSLFLNGFKIVSSVSANEVCNADSSDGSCQQGTSHETINFSRHWSIGNFVSGMVVLLAVVIGILSAAVLGALITIIIFLKSGKKYNLQTQLPNRLQGLQTLLKVRY